jgi:hypothetical protein
LSLSIVAKRSLKFVEYLSKEKDLDIILLMPSKEGCRDLIYSYKVDFYSFSAAYYDWSEELDNKLMTFDFVIVQTESGAGFNNCSVLPRKVNVIVDGWIPMVAKLPVKLLTKHKIQRKFYWEKFMPQYQNLLKRSNCLLCANDKQRYFYEGQFFMIGKLGWNAFKFSPIHKIPFGCDFTSKMEMRSKDKIKLLWYGDVNHYQIIEELIDFIAKKPRFELDILSTTKEKSLVSRVEYKIKDIVNVKMITAEKNIEGMFGKYTAGIYIANNWIDDEYTYNNNMMEMLSHGLPVITKDTVDKFTEYNSVINDGLYILSNINDLNNISTGTLSIKFSGKAFDDLKKALSWGTAIKPLVNYIKEFSNE